MQIEILVLKKDKSLVKTEINVLFQKVELIYVDWLHSLHLILKM